MSNAVATKTRTANKASADASRIISERTRAFSYVFLSITAGLWIIPLIILWEEGRKYIIRNNKEGIIAQIFYF